MPNAAWKALERWWASVTGGKRMGPTGRDGPDVISPRLVSQLKHRDASRFPKYLLDWVNDNREFRDCERMPVVVLHRKGSKRRHSLVVIRADDFLEYVKGTGDE